ncbi:hypothetical protein [Nisaea sp.]|uniref:hypothetical protein n=1 Tax=Nisaea sp. TaxID=2024842 RepID=UPI003297A2AB
MSGKSPWSVKGISAEDREVAKIAARKAGVPIGVWLSEQIRQASEEPTPPEPPVVERPHMSDEEDHRHPPEPGLREHPPQQRQRSGQVDPRFAFGRGQWSVAEEAVDKGMVGNASAAYPWQFRNVQHPSPAIAAPAPSIPAPVPANVGYPPPMQQPQPQHMPVPAPQPLGLSREEADEIEKRVNSLEGRLRDMQQRINTLEDKTLARFEPILAKIESLTAEIDRVDSKPALIAEGDASFSTAPIERAVMRLSERLGRVEQTVLPGSRRGRGFFSRLFRRG